MKKVFPKIFFCQKSIDKRKNTDRILWALGFGLWALGFGLWALGFGLLISYVILACPVSFIRLAHNLLTTIDLGTPACRQSEGRQ